MLIKNLRHRLKLNWLLLKLMRRHDVLIERAVTVKYIDSISFGTHCTLQSGVYVYGSRGDKRVAFGDHVVIGTGGVLLGEGGLEIGSYTHLGPRVVITTQYGDSGSNMQHPDTVLKYAAVRIGKGCWLGAGSIIMPGATLGDNCIVAPGSVVFGAWRDGTVLSGNPARQKPPSPFARSSEKQAAP